MNLKSYLKYTKKNMEDQPYLDREKNITGCQKEYQIFISLVQKEDG